MVNESRNGTHCIVSRRHRQSSLEVIQRAIMFAIIKSESLGYSGRYGKRTRIVPLRHVLYRERKAPNDSTYLHPRCTQLRTTSRSAITARCKRDVRARFAAYGGERIRNEKDVRVPASFSHGRTGHSTDRHVGLLSGTNSHERRPAGQLTVIMKDFLRVKRTRSILNELPRDGAP